MAVRAATCAVGILIVVGIMAWIFYTNAFPTSEYIRGFARTKGVPSGNAVGLDHHGAIPDVLQVCRRDPLCVGVSNRRYFVSTSPMKRGAPLYMKRGLDAHEFTYAKDEFPAIFL